MQDGMGLERRAHYLSAFWQDHLSRTRAAQARWAQTASGDVLTVLGAGPLFDFNAMPLARSFKRFRLVDANPLSAAAWGRLNTPVEPVITDISNCLTAWSDQLRSLRRPWDETLRFIENIAATPVPAYAPLSDGLLSLNLLSQLEVGWQEIVEPLLHKRFGRAFVQSHEQEWLNAIRPASQALAEQHLVALEASHAKNILLISDAEYVDYTGRQYQVHHLEPPPVQWSEQGWQGDPGIQYEVTPALEAVPLAAVTLLHWLPSYRLQWQESWLWHIAPSGTEATPSGKIHRVAAFALAHFDSVST